jgi:hypothetical protein
MTLHHKGSLHIQESILMPLKCFMRICWLVEISHQLYQYVNIHDPTLLCRVNKESCHTPYFRVKLARGFLIFGADSFRLAIFFSRSYCYGLFFIPYKTINRTKTSNPKLKRHKLRKKKPYRETRARSKGSAFVSSFSPRFTM